MPLVSNTTQPTLLSSSPNRPDNRETPETEELCVGRYSSNNLVHVVIIIPPNRYATYCTAKKACREEKVCVIMFLVSRSPRKKQKFSCGIIVFIRNLSSSAVQSVMVLFDRERNAKIRNPFPEQKSARVEVKEQNHGRPS